MKHLKRKLKSQSKIMLHDFIYINILYRFSVNNIQLFIFSNARMVSGTSHPHVLWNYFGRQKAMELLLNI